MPKRRLCRCVVFVRLSAPSHSLWERCMSARPQPVSLRKSGTLLNRRPLIYPEAASCNASTIRPSHVQIRSGASLSNESGGYHV
ncbi:uncharacterized protein GGS22DRAFT_167901 [Annulohypoxylon maeteangense]|uniref:uncharacterized protein n=1 Tax=Annulohypoxylon maeteangense TaxID=1927788 RepID=UPI002008D5F6|nr:uncharacterized protein GGS22DRAFT_167901 [Annulohypoxylon maeteangense]KAI0883111.1 hypothetical protein GGS22DRAFT_167901 [Annulohypoxylon maeteangense]